MGERKRSPVGGGGPLAEPDQGRDLGARSRGTADGRHPAGQRAAGHFWTDMRRRDWSRERVGDPGRHAQRPRNLNNESFPIDPRCLQVWRTARLNLAIGRGIHGRSTGKDLGHTLAWLEGSRFGVTGGSQPALLSGR